MKLIVSFHQDDRVINEEIEGEDSRHILFAWAEQNGHVLSNIGIETPRYAYADAIGSDDYVSVHPGAMPA